MVPSLPPKKKKKRQNVECMEMYEGEIDYEVKN